MGTSVCDSLNMFTLTSVMFGNHNEKECALQALELRPNSSIDALEAASLSQYDTYPSEVSL